MQNGIYIYGVVNSPLDISLPTYLIPYKDLFAVASNEEIVELTHLPKDVLARKLINHQKVIENIMGLKHTIIPIKLGTFANNQEEVQEILMHGYDIFNEAFHNFNNKIELDVVATWTNLTTILKSIGEEKDIAEAKKLLTTKITVEDQMAIGLMVKKSLDNKREKLDAYIRSTLSKISQDIQIHELMDDTMITNAAFLLNASKQAEFEQLLDQLNMQTGETLNFRCVGPLPPYSFCTIEVENIKYEDVDWARTKLRLPYSVKKEEIKKAYQTQAILVHPDKHPEIPVIAFEEVNKAYKILVDYQIASDQINKQSIYSFSKQDIQHNNLLIKQKIVVDK